MKHLILLALIFCGAATSAGAQCRDQDASTHNACLAGFGQVDLAQSFQQSAAGNINGAGVYMDVYGYPETLTISLWDALPNAGGNLLASGTGTASPSSWFNVSWACVDVTAGATYYLVFSSPVSMCYGGDLYNGYPYGQMYANPGFGSFPNYDYTFRTFNCCSGGGPSLAKTGTCPGPLTLEASNCTPSGRVAFLYGNAGNSSKPSGLCAGTTLAISNPTLAIVRRTDMSGAAAVSFNAPPGVCGMTVQIVDVVTCTPSNAITL